ncbi:MAG TPA: DUF6340 family protein [Bacteroidales bacterium]|nr:DUF6340 family protein [Bacteroidales bacterium]
MKKTIPVFLTLMILLLFISCSTIIQTQKTYSPEIFLPADTNRIVFVNFFDYTVPSYIKDKQEVTYRMSVKGFWKGLEAGFMPDPSVHFMVGDTLSRRKTVMSMQDSTFRDTIVDVCRRFNANLLIALDSINIWIDEEQVIDEDNSTTSEYYLNSYNYVTLYSSEGEAIDRSTAKRSKFYKSRPAFFLGLLTFPPSLAKAAADVAGLSEGAGRDYAGKFYPFSENVNVNLFTGKVFNETNKLIRSGNYVEAIEPLRQLTASTDKKIAKKAAHNLSVVYDIMENRRTTERINSEFMKKKE